MWWADNLWLLARSRAMLKVMIQEATEALAKYGLRWKIKSAELLVSPTVPPQDRSLTMELPTMHGTREIAEFKVGEQMAILGCMVDNTGSTETILVDRLASAERAYWSKLKVWAPARREQTK